MRKIIGILVSAAILAIIYWQIDIDRLGSVLAGSSPFWLTVSLSMVIPLTFLTALRLSLLMPRGKTMGVGEATRLTLMASVLNMILPSKMGDIAKAYAVADRCQVPGSFALSLVVFEKGWDMVALLIWCVGALLVAPDKGPMFWGLTALTSGMLAAGLIFLGSPWAAHLAFGLADRVAPGKVKQKIGRLSASWEEIGDYFWRDRARALMMIGLSVLIWFLHLLQIWLFVLALNAWVPFGASLSLAPLAILVGLLPFTFAGIGTRDAALIFFYQPYLAAPAAAALGLLCTLRYFLPALAGLPFLSQYAIVARQAKSLKAKQVIES